MAIAPVLGVIIGLIFVYFVFSMLCSGLNEFIARIFEKRALFLEAGIGQLLDNSCSGTDAQYADSFRDGFWGHPLVRQLGQAIKPKAGWLGRARRQLWRGLRWLSTARAGRAVEATAQAKDRVDAGWRPPSYVPKETFSSVVQELLRLHPDRVVDGSCFGAAIASIEREAGADLGRQREAMERWFDNQMERVSGWYKRESKSILFGLGMVVVLLLNVDSISIARTLWDDPTQRALVEEAAAATVEAARQPTTTDAAGATPMPPAPVCPPADRAATTTVPASPEQQLATTFDCSFALPIGWRLSTECLVAGQAEPQKCHDIGSRLEDIWLRMWRQPGSVLLKLLGLFITAGALSFGAPFWFDVLNRFGSLRSTGTKPS